MNNLTISPNMNALRRLYAVLSILWTVALGVVLPVQPAYAGLFGCQQTSSQCVSSGCKTFTDSSTGGSACICTAGTTNVPQGCVVDQSTSCWDYAKAYQCYNSSHQNTCDLSQYSGCDLIKSTCTQKANNGQCVSYDQTYACPNKGTTTCTNGTPGANCSSGNVTCNATVDGYCTDETTAYTCSTAASRCNTDPQCIFDSQACTSTTNGVCSTVKQTYTCSKEVKTCTQVGYTNSCTQVETAGYENQTANKGPSSFDKAMQGEALLQAIKKNISADSPPKIFGGHEATCKQTVGCSLGTCCCSDSVKASSGSGWTCSVEEANLAGAKRSNLAVSIGSGCSSGIKDPFGNSCLWCLQTEQWYCTFPSILSKLIQVQGRQQLAAMAANSYAGATQKKIAFTYYGNGGWLGPYTNNGNSVWVYQWPTACNSTNTAMPSGTSCPTMLSVWFASCAGSSCPAPTQPPPNAPPQRDSLARMNSSNNYSLALSRYVVSTGSCDPTTQQCSYTLSAWPGGNGGTALLNMQVAWSLYNSTAVWNNPTYVGNYAFAGYSIPLSSEGQPVNGVSLRYSTDSGQNWSQVTIPIDLPATQNYQIPGTQITVYGQCKAPYYQCDYHVVAPATATAKPWVLSQSSSGCHTNYTPDCSGFTIGQFSLLNLNSMDLSEWTNSLHYSLPNSSADNSKASTQAASLESKYAGSTTGQTPMNGNNSRVVVKLNKTSCQIAGGTNTCDIHIRGTSNWSQTYPQAAQNNNPVQSVTYAWGDGATTTVSQPTYDSESGLMLLQADHQYGSTGNYTITATFKMPDGSLHTAKVQLQAYADNPPVNQQQQSGKGGDSLIPGG